MKKLVITGGNGLLGSEVIRILSDSYEIYALTRGNKPGINSKVKWYQCNLSENFDYQTIGDKVDSFIYLAQSDHFRDFPARATDIFEVNTVQVLNALDYCRKSNVKNFIFASSGGVYGFPALGVDESEVIPASGNLGFYLSSKICSEILIENYAAFFNISILRFFFIYGRNQKKGMLIPRLLDSVNNGYPINLEGDNGILINPVHVSDAARALKASIGLPGCNKFNIAGPEILSIREISQIMGKKINKDPIFSIASTKNIRNLVANIDSMKTFLSPPVMKFSDGISDLIAG
jgi:nucleoside-diphosphate-sugar epimerase